VARLYKKAFFIFDKKKGKQPAAMHLIKEPIPDFPTLSELRGWSYDFDAQEEDFDGPEEADKGEDKKDYGEQEENEDKRDLSTKLTLTLRAG